MLLVVFLQIFFIDVCDHLSPPVVVEGVKVVHLILMISQVTPTMVIASKPCLIYTLYF